MFFDSIAYNIAIIEHTLNTHAFILFKVPETLLIGEALLYSKLKDVNQCLFILILGVFTRI